MKAQDLNSGAPEPGGANTARWFVARTRARCEKKLAEHCVRHGLTTSLPCYKAVHQYRGKTVEFQKPLFPGYVFLRLSPGERSTAFRSEALVELLEVEDQGLFAAQLEAIGRAIEIGLELRLAPKIGEGQQVRIVRGPLRGVEGWVQQRQGMSTVLLRIDFIAEAAAVEMDAEDLEEV